MLAQAVAHHAACLGAWGEYQCSTWDYGFREVAIPVARLRQSLDALQFLLEKGARWMPDDRLIAETRRSLYRLDGEAIAAVLDILRKHRACDEKVVDALVRTPKMRIILNAVAGWKTEAKGRARPGAVVSKRRCSRSTPGTPMRSIPRSRDNRERLYEEVWTEPTQKVAERYGVSDVAIAKACALLDIPKPPRGYWAKYAAGHKPPKRPPLPK